MGFKNYFSKQARKPSGIFGQLFMSKIFDIGNIFLNTFMKEMLSLENTDYVLEIGFGTGKLISEMADIVNKGLIEGIDFSETMVAIAQKRNKKYIDKGKIIIKQGDFEKTSYNDNSFDKICSANTIYFWKHPDNYIKKISKILKPGGKLVLGFADKEYLQRKKLSRNIFQFYSKDDIKQLLKRNGFSNVIDIITREKGSQKCHCAIAMK